MSRIRLVIPGEVDLKRNNSTSKASKVRSRWEGGGVEFSNKHGTFINLFRLVGTLSLPTNYDCLTCVCVDLFKIWCTLDFQFSVPHDYFLF